MLGGHGSIGRGRARRADDLLEEGLCIGDAFVEGRWPEIPADPARPSRFHCRSLTGWPLRRKIPPIVDLLVRAGTVSSDALTRIERSQADILFKPSLETRSARLEGSQLCDRRRVSPCDRQAGAIGHVWSCRCCVTRAINVCPLGRKACGAMALGEGFMT